MGSKYFLVGFSLEKLTEMGKYCMGGYGGIGVYIVKLMDVSCDTSFRGISFPQGVVAYPIELLVSPVNSPSVAYDH